jgi:transposase
MLSLLCNAPDKPSTGAIPVQVNAEEFREFILPHLSLPRRGPKCKIGYHKVFNYLLKVLYTGIQWKELPIERGVNGKAEIHYTGVFKLFGRWSEDGSLERAFIASVERLDQAKQLDLSLLHGDGCNTVAKKGARRSAIVGINTRLARK